MGTNFYTLTGRHIGKRSAAGLYCWDCKMTLRRGGESLVHHSDYGPFEFKGRDMEWFEKCTKCGGSPRSEGISEGALGRELGFNKTPYEKKTGVSSCSSFSWAIDPKTLKSYIIKDEYGRRFTRAEFFQMLEECPIRFYDMIGKEFS